MVLHNICINHGLSTDIDTLDEPIHVTDTPQWVNSVSAGPPPVSLTDFILSAIRGVFLHRRLNHFFVTSSLDLCTPC